MARWLRRILLALAFAFALFGVSFSVSRVADGSPFYDGATFWCAFGAAAFVAFAALKFPPRRQFILVFLFANALLLELLLQVTAWLGVLPGISAKDRCAYGRVYWTSEGRGNSIRNRQGWYSPKFDLHAARRIAVIGDSLVEAVEVHRTKNLAAQLGTALPSGTAVYGLGWHGTAPAHYLEMIAYAARRFQPQEIVLVISAGSDIGECVPELSGLAPETYLTYQLDATGRAVVHPASVAARDRFIRALEYPHSSLFTQAPVILRTHCMALQVFNSIRGAAETRRRLAARAEAAQLVIGEEEREDFLRTGFQPAPCAIEPTPDTVRAKEIMFAELRLAKEFCTAHNIALRLVAAPRFPAIFYRTQRGREWTTRIGAYDYLEPARATTEFARREGIPHLDLGAAMKAGGLDVEDLRPLYFGGSSPHLTEQGHAYVATQIAGAFYRSP